MSIRSARRRGLWAAALLSFAWAWPRPAPAGERPRVAVELEPAAGVAPWRAASLEVLLTRELADEPRFELIGEDQDEAPDLLFRGRLAEDEVRYEVRRGSPGVGLLGRGSIPARDSSPRQLVRGVRRALEPALTSEALPGASRPPPAAAGAAARPPPGADRGLLALWLAGAALFVASPLLLGALALGRRRLRGLTRLRSFHLTAWAWGGIAAVAYAAGALGEPLFSIGEAAIWIAGGVAWGWLLASTLPLVFPPIGGFERVEHRDLVRLLFTWLAVSVLRAARVAAFYAPFALVLYGACAALEIPAAPALALVAPLVGLAARFWMRSVVENLSLYLDRELVSGEASEETPWHAAVRGYFLGYVRRNGWPADEDLLDRILFLPGRGESVFLYGGGLTHSRVVLGTDLLEMATAPWGRPHDYAPEREHKLLWTEWNVGLVVPQEIDAQVADAEARRPRHAPVPGEAEREPLGEAPTLASYVEPDALDPRRGRDVNQDPLWLAWDPGEEYDGTDPNDKDFLFGALVRELGSIQRRDDELSTLACAARLWLRARVPRLLGWGRRAAAPLAALSRPPALLADAFTGLNFARHHLIQYLAWQKWRREELLTSRAYAPELERQSDQILDRLERQEPGASPLAGPDLRARLVWMSRFLRDSVPSRRAVLVRRAAIGAVLAGALVAASFGVKRAFDYHPIYVDRMQEKNKDGQAE